MIRISEDDISAIEREGIANLSIELTTQCNSACVMCPNSKLPRMDMAENDILEVIKLINKKVHCDFVGIGEPLLHPRWDMAFRMAAKRSERVFISTNAICLDEKKASTLIETGIHKISVSMDAAEPATYHAVRGIDAFESAVEGVRNLVKARNRLNRRGNGVLLPQIQFCVVILRRNLPAIPEVIELAAKLGVDMVKWQNALPSGDILSEVPYTIPGIHKLSEEEARGFDSILTSARSVAGNLGVRLFDCAGDLGETFHGHGESDLTIGANGDVAICNPALHRDIRIINGKVEDFQWVIGNLHRNSLVDLLGSEKYQSFRASLSDDRCPEACRGCLGYADMWW